MKSLEGKHDRNVSYYRVAVRHIRDEPEHRRSQRRRRHYQVLHRLGLLHA